VYASENDEVQFAKLIVELLDNPERRERMGKIGRRRVEQALSWEVSQGNLLAAYEDLLARPPRRRERGRRRGLAGLWGR
jgi:glycosyltransferase involved in cell wall biosynthesis